MTGDSPLGQKETYEDTGAVLSRMVDAVSARLRGACRTRAAVSETETRHQRQRVREEEVARLLKGETRAATPPAPAPAPPVSGARQDSRADRGVGGRVDDSHHQRAGRLGAPDADAGRLADDRRAQMRPVPRRPRRRQTGLLRRLPEQRHLRPHALRFQKKTASQVPLKRRFFVLTARRRRK